MTLTKEQIEAHAKAMNEFRNKLDDIIDTVKRRVHERYRSKSLEYNACDLKEAIEYSLVLDLIKEQINNLDIEHQQIKIK